MAVTEQVLKLPTDEQIGAIKHPEDLPDFLNNGTLWGLARIIKGAQGPVDGLAHESVVIGDMDYLLKPKEHSGMLASVRQAGHLSDGIEEIMINSNLGPGLFLRLFMDENGELQTSRLCSASHVDGEITHYLKLSDGPAYGRASSVGRVIRSAMPLLMDSPGQEVNRGTS